MLRIEHGDARGRLHSKAAVNPRNAELKVRSPFHRSGISLKAVEAQTQKINPYTTQSNGRQKDKGRRPIPLGRPVQILTLS